MIFNVQNSSSNSIAFRLPWQTPDRTWAKGLVVCENKMRHVTWVLFKLWSMSIVDCQPVVENDCAATKSQSNRQNALPAEQTRINLCANVMPILKAIARSDASNAPCLHCLSPRRAYFSLDVCCAMHLCLFFFSAALAPNWHNECNKSICTPVSSPNDFDRCEINLQHQTQFSSHLSPLIEYVHEIWISRE